MNIARKATPYLIVFHKLNKYYGKRYCYPSQDTIVKQLKTQAFHEIKRRQVNYDLKEVANHGIIRRICRHKRTKLRGMEFHSTLYEITFTGYQLLVKLGVISFSFFKGLKNALQQEISKKKKPCAINPWTPDISHKNKDLTPMFQDSG